MQRFYYIFDKTVWLNTSEFYVGDTIQEANPDLILTLSSDKISDKVATSFERQDTPSVLTE